MSRSATFTNASCSSRSSRLRTASGMAPGVLSSTARPNATSVVRSFAELTRLAVAAVDDVTRCTPASSSFSAPPTAALSAAAAASFPEGGLEGSGARRAAENARAGYLG